MNIRGVAIDDTFAEAFAHGGHAITITGPTRRWARNAAASMTGFATSMIGCGCEAGIDRELRLPRRRTAAPACASSSCRCRRRSCRSSSPTASASAF